MNEKSIVKNAILKKFIGSQIILYTFLLLSSVQTRDL